MEFDFGTVYLFSFFLGLFFALASILMTTMGGGADTGSVDSAPAMGEVLDHGDLTSGHQTGGHEIQFSPFSPPVIATFAAGFGGGGYIAHNLTGLSALIVLLIAFGSGFFLAFLLYMLLSRVFVKSQASSEPRTNELIGTTAEVTIAIPKGGTGEVGYSTLGARYTAPAVSASGDEIPSHTIVLIQRITSGLFHVEPARAGTRSQASNK